MPPTATGRFDVTLTPASTPDPHESSDLGRLDLRKTFEGDLVGESVGQMLTAMSQVDGSAGYVAIERFTGTLEGRTGSFVLQHSGSMDRGKPELTIQVVADTGSDGLQGLRGTMQIQIVDDEHSYRFEYSLDATPRPAPPASRGNPGSDDVPGAREREGP